MSRSKAVTPLVGITTPRERARWRVWDQLADTLPAEYARAVEGAGAIVVLLPPQDPANAADVVRRLDGVVISGGVDVDPARYGAEPHERTDRPRVERDAWEIAVLDAAAEADLPTLMICRGMQVEAVRVGGALDQHLPDIVGHELHAPGGDSYGDVAVTTVDGTRVAELLGPGLTVRCHHHQAVRAHPGLVPAAHSADGVLEAMEHPDRRFWVAVQWHPETQTDAGLFAGLVEAARSVVTA